MSFKISFILKQHTPIIHFKPEDVPIRATELKPAFDKFLGFTSKKDKNYKITITYNNKKENNINRNMLYFGNIKNRDIKFVYADIRVEFFSFSKSLLEEIKQKFPQFLFQYNFATRKTKGFGSFTADDKVYLPKHKKVFSFECDINEWDKTLGYFYKLLRQGINEKGFYVKPLIFNYACKKGINWEKKAIKQCLNSRNIINNNAKHQVNSCKGDYKIIRDVFGLSTTQRWMGYNVTIKKKGEFARFPSPLFFKPIKQNNKMKIYFWVEDYASKIFDKKFTIKIDNSVCKNLAVMRIDWDEFFDNYILRKDDFISNKNHFIYKKYLNFQIKAE